MTKVHELNSFEGGWYDDVYIRNRKKINIYLSLTPRTELSRTYVIVVGLFFFIQRNNQNHYSWFWCEVNHRKLCHSCNCINIYLEKWIFYMWRFVYTCVGLLSLFSSLNVDFFFNILLCYFSLFAPILTS